MIVKNRIWYRKIGITEAEKAEREYYSALSPEERLSIVQELRESFEKFGNESRKGLRRFLKIIKQK